jgi:hypothetical protein
MPPVAQPGLLHATSLGWHDIAWGVGFVAAIALVYWLVYAWLRRRA